MKNRFMIITIIVLIPIGFMITLAYFMDKRQKIKPGGETTYMHYCSGCHGKTGNGRGITSKVKKLDTPNFRSLEFWELSNDEDLLEVIKDGQNKMPKFEKFLKERDRKEVLAYIKKTFKPKQIEESD